MIDIFLLIVTVVMAVALLGVNVYVLVYFQHPDDKNTAYFPKFLVILGLLLAEASVLLLPLDVANGGGAVGCSEGWNTSCGGFNMELVWLITFVSTIAFVILLIPFAIFYYEAEEPDGILDVQTRSSNGKHKKSMNSALCAAVRYEIGALIVSVTLFIISYSFLSTTSIPVKEISQPSSQLLAYNNSAPIPSSVLEGAENLEETDETISMQVTFPIYVTALMSFVGWFILVVFAGIGMAALPLDLIRAFVYRPRFMPADIYAEQKLSVQRRVQELLEVGMLIKQDQLEFEGIKQTLWQRRKQKHLDSVNLNKFKQMVLLLEKDYEEMTICHKEFHNYNPLVPVAKLLLGILCCIVSFIWMLQICVYLLPPVPLHPLLNSYFIWFDTWFPLFGTISVGIFAMYFLAAVVKGCFKFGIRFFFIPIYPMKLGGTMMNSFLFNLGFILLACIPVAQFCAEAFADYVRLTDIHNIFGAQIRYLEFFSIFYVNNVFVYALVSVATLSMIYLVTVPKDTPLSATHLKAQLRHGQKD